MKKGKFQKMEKGAYRYRGYMITRNEREPAGYGMAWKAKTGEFVDWRGKLTAALEYGHTRQEVAENIDRLIEQ